MDNSQTLIDTDRYWQIIQRRWKPGLIAFSVVTILGIIATAMKPDIYQAEAKLKFKKSNAVSGLSEISRELGALAPLAEKSNPINTEAQVIQSKPIIRETIQELDIRNEEGELIQPEKLLSNLRVAEVIGTDILRLSYQGEDPKKVQEIINSLVANYLENNITTNREEAIAARQFLEEQIPKAEAELAAVDTKIREFKIANQVVSPEDEATRLVQTLSDLEKQITESRSQLSQANSQSQYLREKLNMDSSQAIQASAVAQSLTIRQILEELKTLTFELNEAKSRFTEEHPVVIELEERIRRQEQLLNAQADRITSANPEVESNPRFGQVQQEMTAELVRLESTRTGLTQRLQDLTQLQGQLQQKAAKLPELEQQLKQLLRDAAVAQETYELLQQQLSTIEIAANQNIGNVRVIANATTPVEPVSSRSVGYLASAILGAIAGVAVSYLLEAKDRSLKTVEEAKQLFGYEWLGIVPSFDKSQLPLLEGSDQTNTPPLVVRDYPASAISESYRMLQSNLRFLKSDEKVQTIVVTSSVPGEGKSTVAANLASAMAQAGHKVLLVDADLHSPQQQNIWGTYSNQGLSNLLAENLDSRLGAETVMRNLSVISAGAIPPSPSTLLDSYRMKDLIYYWSRSYDYVIIDTPALKTSADAPILGRMADGILLVVKPEAVSQSQAKCTKETLQRSGENVLGIVFNDIDPKLDTSVPQYHPLEASQSQNALPGADTFAESEGELWKIFSRLSEKKQNASALVLLDKEVTSRQLEKSSVQELEETIGYLQKDLQKLTTLVKEQEDELFAQLQKVRKLQRKVNLSSTPERFELEKQLAHEQERKKLLDDTLVGQRRNLSRKRKTLRQYQEALQFKQV